MDASGVRRSFVEVLLAILTILSCPALAQQSTTEDPNSAQLDFGDAPDTYRTLLASDGARHIVVPGVCLGRTVEAEADAKPGPAANGDNLDEDGVVFTSSLSPGEPVTVEVAASTQGYLNAWGDFNLDGSFAGKGEQIFNDQLLAPGVNRLAFNVPPTAAKGLTYTRFRFNTRGLLSYSGPAADGEVEDYSLAIGQRLLPQMNSGKGGFKWSQIPQQFDATTPFIFNGWGQPSDLHLRQVAADDWRCDDNQPITGFQWYGSFEGWTQPALPQEMPLAFHLAIWTDSAAAKAGDPNATGHPDTLVWEKYCTHWTWNVAGYYSDPRRLGDDTSFQFTCLLSQDQWFHPQPAADDAKSASTVYWLSIAAFYDPNASTPTHPWGWTTRPQFFGSGAVRIESIEAADPRSIAWPPAPGSQWKSGRRVECAPHTDADRPELGAGGGVHSTPYDLAFELLTTQAANSRDPDLSPVYQFRSDKLGDHLYTLDEAQKARLQKDCPDVWTFEGVAFYAYPPNRAPVGSKPIYRFWSDRLGHHSYATSESEKQRLVDNSAQGWTFEGIAWYAFD